MRDADHRRMMKAYRIHGMWPQDWAALWEAQGGRCYLCGADLAEKKIHVDHDHSCCPPERSCEICRRGLACGACNHAIGFAGDDPARLRRMADALETAKLAVAERITQRRPGMEQLLLPEA